MVKLYLSFSRSDTKVAETIFSQLQKNGFDCFKNLDDEIHSGDPRFMDLISQIKDCSAILFLVSKDSLNSQWARREIEFALSLGKKIIPILISRETEQEYRTSWFVGEIKRHAPLYLDSDWVKELLSYYGPTYSHNDSLSHEKTASDDCGSRPLPCPAPPNDNSWFYPKKAKQDYNRASARNSLSTANKSRFGCISGLGCLSIIVIAILIGLWVSHDSYSPDEETVDYDSTIVDDTYPDLSDEYSYPSYDSCAAYDTCAVIEPDEWEDYETYEPSVSEDDGYTDNPGNDIITDQYTEVESDYTIWFLCFIAAAVAIALILKKRRFTIKFVSNIDSTLYIDNQKIVALKANAVTARKLPKGEYYLTFKPDNTSVKDMHQALKVRNNALVCIDFPTEATKSHKVIKCFIAGSTKLSVERDTLRAAIAQVQNSCIKNGMDIEIRSYTYEDFEHEVVLEGHQKKYDQFICNEADIAIFLICGQIGQHTANEFNKAMGAYKNGKHPQILIFNDIKAEEHVDSLKLKEDVSNQKQYWSDYDGLTHLKLQFMSTLDWMIIGKLYK